MADWLFYFFAALALLSGFFVAYARNPVNAAISMIVCFVSLAALFVLLEAYFLAVLQVLVYAGAIVVLFLFIIMLIDAGSAPASHIVSTIASIAALALLVVLAWNLFLGGHGGELAQITVPAQAASIRVYGEQLYTRYMLPFQVTGFMLLIAMVGVIVISKRVKGEAQ